MSTLTDSIVFSGLSGCFGGAPTPRALWKAILKKQSFFAPLPESNEGLSDDDLFPENPLPEVSATLDSLFACRADCLHMPPDLGIGDNADFWFAAQLVYDALTDAHLPPTAGENDRLALFVGYEPTFNPAVVNWWLHANGVSQIVGILQRFFPNATYEQVDALRAELVTALPLLKPRQIAMAQGSGVVHALAQTFHAGDTAALCTAGEASVFAGLEAAANALHFNQCDVAVVVVLQPPLASLQLAGEAANTPFARGQSLRPYTDHSEGTLPGEGGAAFVLRRLTDARNAGAPIYAKLHGVAQLSGLPPDDEGLQECLRRTLHRALRRFPNGFRDIDYWEMNGSGIPAEDAAEEALLNRITANRGAHIPLLGLGSAKTSFGNTFIAAGALGLLKGILAVSHRVLPPSVTPVDDTFRLHEPEQAYYWVQEARPWIASSTRPRRLAVSTLSQIGRAGAATLEEIPE